MQGQNIVAQPKRVFARAGLGKDAQFVGACCTRQRAPTKERNINPTNIVH
jgi:hypothetical protein